MNFDDTAEVIDDTKEFRKTLSLFATGVAVASNIDGVGNICGITINSFSSLSLNPKLILFSMQVNSLRFKNFSIDQKFSMSFLASDQEEVSRVFSSYNNKRWREYISFSKDSGDSFVTGCLGYLVSILKKVYMEGDHYLLISEVVRHVVCNRKEPLVFFNSSYGCKKD